MARHRDEIGGESQYQSFRETKQKNRPAREGRPLKEDTPILASPLRLLPLTQHQWNTNPTCIPAPNRGQNG